MARKKDILVTAAIALNQFRSRTIWAAILVLIGAPLSAAAIAFGAPETVVYYLAFFGAAIATAVWLIRPDVSSEASFASSVSTVLLVEDEPDVRQTLSRLLSAHGAFVHAARSWSEALDKLQQRKHEYDLVVLDISLPKQSWADAFSILRRQNPQVTMVLVEVKNQYPRAPTDYTIVGSLGPAEVRDQVQEILAPA